MTCAQCKNPIKESTGHCSNYLLGALKAQGCPTCRPLGLGTLPKLLWRDDYVVSLP